MQYTSLEYFYQHRLPLDLVPIFVAQISLLDSLQFPAYSYTDGEFIEVLAAEEGITSEFIRSYAKEHSSEIYIHDEDRKSLQDKLSEQITRLTRSMSSGDLMKKSVQKANLLSLQMYNLYQDPFNDELLSNQFQNSKNFSNMLMNNKNIHRGLYANIKKQGHHYAIKQPLLSSILLLGFAQHSQLFTEREIKNFFLTSYFKDIGLSYIPWEKFELSNLTEVEKDLFARHAEDSMRILTGRVQLGQSQLKMIENHHFLNIIVKAKAQGVDLSTLDLPISGFESVLMAAIDVFVAMTSERPYRDSVSVFKALEFLKLVLGDEFPQEFKQLVLYIRQFFSK